MQKMYFVCNKEILILAGIVAMAFFIRLIYFPFNIPIILDGADYFWFANDINVLNGFPTDHSIGNSGWPIFLAAIFSLFNFEHFLDYMNLQRYITVFLSILTVFPIYFLCRNFFEKSYSFLAAIFFVFEPRIIQNSLLGITDPLYVFLSTISIVLFFTKNSKSIYYSFIISGIASFVRSEGIFIFAGLTVLYFIQYQKDSKRVKRYFKGLILYLSTILPVIFWRIYNDGSDLISGRVVVEANNVLSRYSSEENSFGIGKYIFHSIENFIQLGGWSLIPMYIVFLPIGIFFIFKQKDEQMKYVLILIMLLLIPVFFAFSVASDVRYIFNIFPMFCLISVYSIKKIREQFKKQKILSFAIIVGVLISSMVFLEVKSTDSDYQREVYEIGKHVIEKTNSINDYYPQSAFLEAASIQEKWPIQKSELNIKTMWSEDDTKIVETSYDSKIRLFSTDGYETLYDFIQNFKNRGLTHIVIDNYEERAQFLKDIYNNEENYPYLKKIYDSKQNGFSKYDLKIYEIDYERFEISMKENMKFETTVTRKPSNNM